MGKSKSKCCKKFKRKPKACSSCPLMARLGGTGRAKLIKKYKKKRKKRA